MFRNTFLFVSIAAFLISAGGCATSVKHNSVVMTEGAEIRTYEVFGMDCPVCHGGLEKRLMKIKGVEHAEANWQEKQIKIIIMPGEEVTDASITKAIEEANFNVGKRIK